MQIFWLRLCLPYSHAIPFVDDPGVWSLSKIHNLPYLTVLGLYGCIAPQARKLLKACTRRKKFLSRRLLGVENLGARDVRLLQYEELDNRYKYLHGRQTVTARRIKQRAAYHKRRRRFPMLSRRRRRGCVQLLLPRTALRREAPSRTDKILKSLTRKDVSKDEKWKVYNVSLQHA